MSENPHKGHRERVKKRYINEGLTSFEDHQVLELLLFYAYKQVDTNKIAHKMIQTFGSLDNLFDAHPKEIEKRCKVSENIAVLVSLIPHLSKRYAGARFKKRDVLSNSLDVGKYCVNLFTGHKYECFYMICLNTQRQVLYTELVHEGTIDAAHIYPRVIVEKALLHKAASVIISHNHPSGKLGASHSDIELTRKLMATLGNIDIDIIDHVIIAGNDYYSFAERGLLGFTY
ncbi:MAG: DNA repair protein RadC [Defluviitaleaceae bacterium]|nr:DNA repair protein RadC [Defluviitaleaceae bacterium]